MGVSHWPLLGLHWVHLLSQTTAGTHWPDLASHAAHLSEQMVGVHTSPTHGAQGLLQMGTHS